MLCKLTVLPITPPAELTDAVRTGSSPTRLAATCCILPNSAFEDLSLAVRKAPTYLKAAAKQADRKRLPAAGM